MGTPKPKKRILRRAQSTPVESPAEPNERYRPLGLVIAILSAALLYGVGPLVLPVLVLIANLRRRAAGVDVNLTPLDVDLPTNIATGLLVFVVCFMAWRGRPKFGRWLLIAVVWLASATQLWGLYRSFQPNTSGGIVGSNLNLPQAATCQAILFVLVPLYLTWYLNRAPARRFYQASNERD